MPGSKQIHDSRPADSIRISLGNSASEAVDISVAANVAAKSENNLNNSKEITNANLTSQIAMGDANKPNFTLNCARTLDSTIDPLGIKHN